MSQNTGVNNTSVNDDDDLYAEAPKEGGNFEPHPQGQFQGIVCDIRNLGMLPTSFKGEDTGEKPHILVSWLTTAKMKLKPNEDGSEHKLNNKPYLISQRYVNSLGDKAKLRKDAEAMIGRKLTAPELKPKGFNLNQLVGLPCILNVYQAEGKKDGKMHGNIDSVMGWSFGMTPELQEVEDSRKEFVRYKDRPKDAQGNVIKENQTQGNTGMPARSGPAQSRDQIELDQLRHQLREAINAGATYGLTPPAGFNMVNLSATELRQQISQWNESTERAKNKWQSEEDDDLSGQGAANLSPDAETAEPVTAANFDPFADEGDPGYVPEGPERDRLIEETKPAPRNPGIHEPKSAPKDVPSLAEASQAPKVAIEGDPNEGVELFDQKLRDLANGQAVGAGKPELPAHILAIYDEVEEAELPVDNKNLLADPKLIDAINGFLTSVNRKPIANVSDLKPAQGAMVKDKIREGKIVL